MTTDDTIDLAAIARRAEAATPGPWRQGSMQSVGAGAFDTVPDEDGDCVVGVCDCGFDSDRSRDDARFIAHARQDIDALLSEVHRLRQRESTLTAAVDAAQARGDSMAMVVRAAEADEEHLTDCLDGGCGECSACAIRTALAAWRKSKETR